MMNRHTNKHRLRQMTISSDGLEQSRQKLNENMFQVIKIPYALNLSLSLSLTLHFANDEKTYWNFYGWTFDFFEIVTFFFK